MRKQGTSAPFCASACWWRCPQTPVSRTPSSCGCASFCGKTLFQKKRVCVKCRYHSCFFCAASSLCSIGSFRIRSTFARTVSNSRLSFFASRHNPFFAALSRLHIPFAAFEQSGASSVFAHQKRLCEILSVNIVFRDTTKVRWDRTAGSAVRLLTTVLPESGR